MPNPKDPKEYLKNQIRPYGMDPSQYMQPGDPWVDFSRAVGAHRIKGTPIPPYSELIPGWQAKDTKTQKYLIDLIESYLAMTEPPPVPTPVPPQTAGSGYTMGTDSVSGADEIIGQ